MLMRNKFFYGGNGIGIPTAKSLTTGRTWQRMLALFALIVTLGIGQMWADEVKLVSEGTTAISKIAGTGTAPSYLGTIANPAVYESGDKSYSVSISTSFSVSEGSEYKPDGSTKYKDYYYNANAACDMSTTPTNYIKVAATGCKISKIVVRVECFNSTPACFPAVGFIEGLPETTTIGSKTGRRVDTLITSQSGAYNSSKRFEYASTLTYTFSTNVSEVYFSKQIKAIAQPNESSVASQPSSSQTSGVFGIDVYVVPNAPSCEEPATALSLTSDANPTIYVGDEIEFSTSGGNGGTITIAGSASETIDDGKWIATEGEHTFTASQAKNGNVCAQETELVLTVNPKTPVVEVTVTGATAGYLNDEVTFTATAEYAASYRWTIDGVAQSSTTATMSFTPTVAGDYSIVCEARNDFNDPGEWIASSTHTFTASKLCGELIKIVQNGQSDGIVSGILTGTKDVKLSSGTSEYNEKTGRKIGSDNYWLGITNLSKPLRAADVVTVYVTTASTKLQLFSDKGTTLIGEMESGVVQGENEIVLNSSATGATAIYLYRTSTAGSAMNPFVHSLSVTRSCIPSTDCSISDVTVNSESVTPVGKVYSYEVPAASALTEVAVAYSIHPLATASPASGFTVAVPDAGDPANTQTITVTAEDGTHSDTYTISVSRAASLSDDATLTALSVTGYTLDPTFAAATEDYTITKDYGTADPTADKVEATPAAGANADIQWDDVNKKFVITVTAEDGVTEKTYTVTVEEAEAPKNLSRVLFSNGFDAFIDNTNHTVKAYYLAGAAVPTATTITAGAGTAGELAEGKITVTGADASTVDYIVTLAEVTPNTTTVAEEAAAGEFAGDEAWVKNGLLIYGNAAGYDGGEGKKWYVNRRLTKGTDPEDDQRVIAGWVRSYFFVGNASKFIMTVGGNNALKYAIDGGDQVANASGTLEIALTKGNHMIEIVSNQNSGDCRLSAPKLVELPPTYAVTYSAGAGSVKDGQSMPTQEAVEAGTVITLASADALEKEGYTFDGWLCDVNSTKYNAGAEYTMTAAPTTFTAQWADASYVAQIGEAKYATLEAALEHAADGTIVLARNIDVTAQIEILAGVTAVIDLAGNTINYTGTSTLPSGVILVHNGASLTIDDSSDPDAGSIVAGNKAYAAVALTKAGDDAANPAILTVNGGTLSGYYYGITGNGSRHNTVTTINGGTIIGTCTGDNLGIYHPQNGTLTINGGTITAYSAAVEMRAGELEINGGTLTATATEYSCTPNGSGTTTVGAAIAISQHTTKKDIAVTISGGTFEGVKAINESNPQVNDPAPQVDLAVTGGDFTGEVTTVDVNNFISGGTFDAAVAIQNCANGYVPAEADPVSGKFSVEEGWKVTFVDGEDEEIVAVDKNTPVAEKAMSDKIGYTFDGWFNGVDLYDFTANVTADLTLNAHWTAFDGCADLWPATSGAALNVGDNVDLQTGSAGGSIAVVGMKTAESSIAYNADGLYFNGGSADVISVTLNNDMAVGTKISVILKSGNTGARGLNLLNATGGKVKGGTKLGWDDATIGAVGTFSYTVEAGDGLEGTNIFRLQRNNSVYLQCVRVESCGAAIVYHNVTSEVNIAGKGTVTLGATSVREGYSTTATYSDIDPLYEFVSWSVSGEGASLDDATANPVNVTVGSEDAVVTLNLQLIPVKFTVNYYDGASLMGSELVAVNEHPTASEIATAKRHYTFQGWSETDGGSVVALNTITSAVAATINLYAVYAPVVCPTEGTVFSMEFDDDKRPSSTVKVAKNGGTLDLADYATLVGGNAVIENTETSDKDAISTDGKFKLTATKEVMKIELECAIATGDVIRIPDNNAKYVLSTSNTKTGTYQAQTSSQHEFEATAAWNGVDDLYILYDGSSLSFTKVYVLRPYTVSFDLQGHGDAIVAQKLVEGKKVAEPTAPTADGWDFGGWYKEAACTNAWDFSNDVVEGNMPLFAKWTEHVTNDATLKSLKYGTTAITLVDGTYTYEVELAAAVAAVPALSAETNAALATKVITDATEFVAGQATSTVLVTAEDGATQLLYTVNFTKAAAVDLVDVTGNMKWDFSKADDGSAASSNLCNDEILANVAGIVNNSNFESDNIKATANKFSSNKLQASMIKFHTTVPGAVIVKFANTGNKSDYRYLVVNGVQSEAKSKDGTMVTYAEYVPAGDVVLTVTTANEGNMFNFTSVEFKVDKEASLARTDSWLAPGERGTICIPNGAVAVGADIYELEGREPQYGKVVFQSVKHMKPGKPYMFIAKGNRIDFITTDEAEASEPDNSGAMKGTFDEITITENLEDVYYFAGTALWGCADLTATGLHVSAHRAYVKLSEADYISDPNPAPGRRRLMMNVVGPEAAPTALENIFGDDAQNAKLLIDGKLYILRGGKMFDATGRLVK